VDLDPLAYDPPVPRSLEGPLAPNDALRAAEVLTFAAIAGPETVAVGRDGTMVVGTHDGALVKVTPDGTAAEVWVKTGGRPLGLAWDASDNLIVCDAVKGLLSVAPDGAVTVLATEAAGVPFKFTDDVDVARDGRLYFSDASSRWGYGDHVPDLLEARGWGRLLRYDPTTSRTEVLLDGLHFANGVALSTAEDFVLVAETGRTRLVRYWLEGDKKGTSDVFIDALPGYPDGVSNNRKGRFWVALFTVVNPIATWLAPSPFLKKAVYRLPRALWPRPKPYGLVVALDEKGAVIESLHDVTGEVVSTVTSAEEHGGMLYLGTLHAPHLARMAVE
jgi:sugar lactone lactonase YvrE